ncbi:MAG: DUF3089 domain-containing protein [Bacteroidales bacterium]
MKLTNFIFCTLLLLVSCKGQSQDNESQYSDSQLWYRDANTAGDKNFDVFYLLPTCVWDRVDVKGDTLYYADPRLINDREAMHPSFELAEQIFGEDANFYSPYYHQLALQSWRSDSLVELRFPRSFDDVKQAFDYYMTNVNKGRPFVLAGFSQGGKCVVELLKTLTNEQYLQMVAAYIIGYKVTAYDTLNYKQIKPAVGEKETGVAICYNSVATTDAICPGLSPSAVCINPINWTTTTSQASLNDTIKVHVDEHHNVLIVDGFNPDKYYSKSLAFLFKKGNYHLQELYFYRNNISENVKLRFKAFDSKR